MTSIFIGVNIVVYLMQLLIPGFTNQLVLVPGLAAYQPWRLITSAFAHSPGSILHILMNMYGVYIFGILLEPRLGRLRFTWLYLLSAMGGSLGVMLWSPANTATLGASGALAGLFLAAIIILRGNKPAVQQLVIVLGLNVALGFFVSGISWQAHLGGAIVGTLAALCVVGIPRSNPQRSIIQVSLLSVLSVVIVGATYAAVVGAKWTIG
ncbi:rhomboid family intramembrane serine protease [Glutamicibacter sp.]|uniref:rhomboid family intramembrane serine protease n=1 Tax=Glutamicibacter sp. TaxID=1931995 RepID=UPI0028BE1142|nr:rhomboid family intramembrane serine protease [Glutamicibacter sp.]